MPPTTRYGAALGAVPAGGPRRVVVTGGNGFLGYHIVKLLASQPEKWAVTVFDVRPPAEEVPGVKYSIGDIRKDEDVRAALEGAEVVVHSATAAVTAKNSLDSGLMEAVNVGGTERIVRFCESLGVRALVLTSSASVVFSGRPLRGVSEDQPYADPPADRYTETKIKGEKIVLAAGQAASVAGAGAGGRGTAAPRPRGLAPLRALALRPSGIFGERDQLAVPEIARNAAAGKLRFVIGDGSNLADWTYAGNVALAHELAAEALLDDTRAPGLSGRAFFVTNDEPRPFWAFMGDVVEGLGYPRPRRHLPFWLIYVIALLVHYVLSPLAKPFGGLKSDFTPFRILLSTQDRVFSCQAAKEDLGYAPAVSLDEGLTRTLSSFPHLRRAEASEGAGRKRQ